MNKSGTTELSLVCVPVVGGAGERFGQYGGCL